MRFLLATALALLVAIDLAAGECSPFAKSINVSMCSWQGLRANIVRDKIYLDGGQLWYQKGTDDGCVSPQIANNLEGTVYYLNLGTPFDSSSDFVTVLNNMSAAGDAGSNIAPPYSDGTMFSNDNEFYLYGGMLPNTAKNKPPPEGLVLSYAAYQYGPYKSSWESGWKQEYLTSGVTRYITNGAAASAPSENLGFYFSGMRAPDWGDFTVNQLQSNTTANTLITVDMSELQDGKWKNETLPSYIPGRSKAELVWVPVSESGVLVAIGGVINPAQFFRNEDINSTRTQASRRISPTFMETVSVFDVKTKTWYLQKTTGDIPPQLTDFCSVVASAEDGSSHNIYIYGGYDGIKYTNNPSDDVYILSLPSFKWVRAYEGTNTHSRSSHRCFKVYPDQMLVVGGQHVDPSHCLEGGLVVNFNLNTLEFEDGYDPKKWGKYKVPNIVTQSIGGDSKGGATTTAPSSWTNSSLAKIFDKKYDKKTETYWPYNSTNSTDSTGNASTADDKKSDGFPGWAGGVIGAVLAVLIIAILAGLWFYRRRKQQRKAAEAKFTEEETTERPTEWMYGSGPVSPGPGPVSASSGRETLQTSATQPSTMQPSITQASTLPDSIVSPATPGTVESGGDALYEMHDSSPVELPTPFNTSYFTQHKSPKTAEEFDAKSEDNTDPRQGSFSPVSPQSPSETDSEFSYRTGRHRRISSLSLTSPMSIDDVVKGRTSHFQESFEKTETRHERHGSDVSQGSDTSDLKGWRSGSETIHENE
ncbi:hypothetical protein N7457_002330 [Penicillium paradoxum]|uniref:uncharacterized protein n=1 Tax=Penicillium paradoxum TaxID=176176 RepID=UPI002547339D|nr:uncharacterized protein N7457_002330 [Penicillium paradoxum]KAJ5787340.1 hypothetical protein N7457_002330 [Penicillium paradoxum]